MCFATESAQFIHASISELELPATRGIIYPWAPHIPREILVKLREELINELVMDVIDQRIIVPTSSEALPGALETGAPKEKDAETAMYEDISARWE